MYPCSALVSLPARPQTLGIYMYLTESEEAGGAPFVFDSPNNRREVNFGQNDILDGIVQSNGQLVVSDFGCPDFFVLFPRLTKFSSSGELTGVVA